MRGENGGLWPSIPAVLRVMTGWFFTGIGALNLAVEMDGGLAREYVVFHVVLFFGGLLLLTRRRLGPSRAGLVVAGLAVAAGMGLGHLANRGYPYPVGVPKFLAADLVFWCCAGLMLLTAITQVERRLPERRTPVDLSRYAGHAENRAMAATPHSTGENVGGLT